MMDDAHEKITQTEAFGIADGLNPKNTLFHYFHLIRAYLWAASPRLLRPETYKRKRALRSSSWLDALRGYAAWIVLNHHCWAYGSTWLMRQPFFRLTWSGRGMVDVFFVISGYVLSYRMLKLMKLRQSAKLLDTLASSTFRRYLRLYAAAAVGAFASLLVMECIPWSWAPVERKETFIAQILDWAVDVVRFSNPFIDVQGWWFPGVFSSRYLDPLWTIPVEFRGSVILFAFCAASCKLSTKNRKRLCWISIVVCYVWEAIYVALFLSGLFLAEISLDRQNEEEVVVELLPVFGSATRPKPKRSTAVSIANFLVLLLALFLLGQPEGGGSEGPFPWPHLSSATPLWYSGGGHEHFWLGIGAFLLVFTIDSSKFLQRPFETNFSQYLGDISFGIYATHRLVIWALYVPLLQPWCQMYFNDSLWGYVPVTIVYYIAAFWAADCFTRVDERVVRLGKWLQTRLFVDWNEDDVGISESTRLRLVS